MKLPVDGSPMKLLLYNSLAHARQTVVRIRANTSWVQVRDPAGSVIAAQVCRLEGDEEEEEEEELLVGVGVGDTPKHAPTETH